MNPLLKQIQDLIGSFDQLDAGQKDELLKLLQQADKKLTITEFKLDRTEKVKKTTGILLEETIEELENKQKIVENSNVELQKTIEELKDTQAQLIHSEKMASLGELTSGIAHEIQNPLNFVNNFSEVSDEMLEEVLEELAKPAKKRNPELMNRLIEDVQANLKKIRRHGIQADAIVKNMMEHSRKGVSRKEWADLNVLINVFTNIAYHSFLTKYKIEPGQEFELKKAMKLEDNLPKIYISPQEIGKVLLNLLNNAIYAVHQKKINTSDHSYIPTLEISTSLLPQENGKLDVVLKVRDNGNGIPDSIKDKIFQPFFSTKPTGSGTGLGLSLCFDIIKAHGGSLVAESKEGEGATFVVVLKNVSERRENHALSIKKEVEINQRN